MGRPSKKSETKNHGDYFEVKRDIYDALGNKMFPRKSFYSRISKADAKKNAEEFQRKYLVNSVTGAPAGSTVVTFKSWAETWLETYKKGKVKDNTYHAMYKNIVDKHLIPHFGSYNISAILPIDVQRFFDKKQKENALETIKKMRSCLTAIFKTAVENGYCAKTPMTESLVISSDKKPVKKRAYTGSEYDKLIEYASTHKNGLDILLLAKTGISRSELLGLKWADIDFEQSVIYINQGTVNMKSIVTDKWQTVSEGLKNEYRRRVIPIDADLLYRLKNRPQTIQVGGNKARGRKPKPVKTEYVIHNTKGGVYNPDNWGRNVYRPFMAEFSKATGLTALNPHELRHTCATHWKDAGVDLFSIAKLGGWSDLDMLSKKYGHNNIDTLKKALKL